jgi:hypothetical protein
MENQVLVCPGMEIGYMDSLVDIWSKLKIFKYNSTF